MTEQWAAVAGHEAKYEVSSVGRVRSLDRDVVYSDGRVARFRGVEMKPTRGSHGYLSVTLNRGKRYLVHRLVGAAFLTPPSKADAFINHLNGDKRDNRIENLEWASLLENNRHARQEGLNLQHGENCNLTKYGSQIVGAVRRVHDRYSPTYRELALLFDMSEMQAADIVKGRTRRSD